MESIGKALMIFGIILVAVGALVAFANKIPFIGKLPGDIYISREKFSFYFPITTCILVSVVVSLILWFISKR